MADKLSLRFVRQYEIATDQIPSRLDVEMVRMQVIPRWRRILRAPALCWRHWRLGVPFTAAVRLAWLTVTF